MRSWPALLLLSCTGSLSPVTDEDPGDDPLGDSGTSFDGRRIAPGMLAFYESADCPEGWSPYAEASGRALVGAHDGDGVGTTVGAALTDHVPAPHTHAVSGTAVVGSAGLSGVAGCCTDSPGTHGSYDLVGEGDARDSRQPTIALQVCMKDGDTGFSPAEDEFPTGTAAFFVRPACPDGWTLIEQGKGRLAVGLTMFGDPLETVGSPLADGEERTHGHAVAGSVDLPVASIAGASGGTQFAASGAHAFSGTSDDGTSGLPYVQALLCGRQ